MLSGLGVISVTAVHKRLLPTKSLGRIYQTIIYTFKPVSHKDIQLYA